MQFTPSIIVIQWGKRYASFITNRHFLTKKKEKSKSPVKNTEEIGFKQCCYTARRDHALS
jgi:hypothetical protein